MTLDLRTLDLLDVKQLQAVIELQQKAYPQRTDLEPQVRHNAIRLPSVFYGAFEGDDLVGVNGFVRHRVFKNGRELFAFQSCSSATDPHHRGKGIFSHIINHAKEKLAEVGAFICGFPNENSARIFLGPLGFTEIPMRKLLSVRLGMAAIVRAVARARQSRATPLQFDQRELFGWQSAKSQRNVHAASVEDSFMWGQFAEQDLFGKLPTVFQIGGLTVSNPRHVTPLFDRILANSRAELFSVAVPETSAFARRGIGRSLSRQAGAFIVFPLRSTVADDAILVYGGLADFF